MTTYEKIRIDNRTLLLKNTSEIEFAGIPSLTGVVVNREGDEIREIKGRPTKELAIFALAEIKSRKPMVMSLHYGELVEA